MPRANPQESFEISARHLFRHINDVHALRTHPLLRGQIPSGFDDDSAFLREVHSRIVMLAEALCEDLTSRGLHRHALRRRAVVEALCKRENPAETARRLGISRSHYYRERHAICVGIARALKRAAPTKDPLIIVRDDPLRLLFKRAEVLRDAGFSHDAVGLLGEAYGCVDDELAKSAVGLGLAEELVFLGNHERARELLARSGFPGRRPAIGGAGDWLHDTWALCGARLESQLRSDSESGSALEMLAKSRAGRRRADDVTFDALFLTGEGYRNAGRFGDARAMLRHLQTMDPQYLQGVAKRRIGISLLTAYCAEDSNGDLGILERSFHDALELSITSGTLIGALLAMAGLIGHYAACGRDDAAYALAHDALKMANGVDFSGFLGYVIIGIVEALLRTAYWHAVNPLLFEIEQFAAPRALGRALLKHAQGKFFLRTGRLDEARAALLEGFTLARELGNRRIEGVILRDQALALKGAGAVATRTELMREAVELVERYGSSSDIAATYEAAAGVLSDRRSQWLARRTGLGPSAGAHREPINPTASIVPLRCYAFGVRSPAR
jgi:tetratricopeptide (TPR) repeat protein